MTRRRYPPARAADVVDNYHGIVVPDPYRWLEDPDSAETRAWVGAQNALTRTTLAGTVRDGLVRTLTRLYDFPRASVPVKRGKYWFLTRNEGLQNQGVLYVQEGAGGSRRVLLDPNTLSPDGTIALTALAPGPDGQLVAYALSSGGSDVQEIAVRDVGTGADRSDRLRWAKFTTIAWTRDGGGFYYTRFPQPGTVPHGDENYFCAVYFHTLGEPQERDRLVFSKPAQREVVFDVGISDDDRWVVIAASEGSSDKSEIYVLDRASARPTPQPLLTGFDAAYSFIEAWKGRLLFRTDRGAPLGKIVAIDPLRGSASVEDVVPEQPDKLSTVLASNRTIVATYLHNASDRIRLFTLDGAATGEVALPAMGTVPALSGRIDDPDLFVGFTSFTHPPASYLYDFAAGSLTPTAPEMLPIDPGAYATRQVWYSSKDGTRVSLFLVHRKDLALDGERPVLLTGYGGFNISLTPAFDPATFALLDRGGVQAVANLRGGGEYGEAWHEAGMFERKQNVFDDFVAAAEWLVQAGYTNPRKLGIEGGSNGGLLTGAVLTQRPELFGAVISRVPVADMLRYHLFTVGRFWVSEYGCADDPAQFPYLYEYSPYHNVRPGVDYPPVLIMTADTDDRVSPGMAKKLAARLQAANPDGRDILIRVETRAGHGAGKPVTKMIEEDADVFAFLFKYLDVPDSGVQER